MSAAGRRCFLGILTLGAHLNSKHGEWDFIDFRFIRSRPTMQCMFNTIVLSEDLALTQFYLIWYVKWMNWSHTFSCLRCSDSSSRFNFEKSLTYCLFSFRANKSAGSNTSESMEVITKRQLHQTCTYTHLYGAFHQARKNLGMDFRRIWFYFSTSLGFTNSDAPIWEFELAPGSYARALESSQWAGVTAYPR